MIASFYLVARNIPETLKSICRFMYPLSRGIGFPVSENLRVRVSRAGYFKHER